MLARPELEQLAQRVIARYHLGPLSEAETGAYVAHRLAVAGVNAATPIPASLAPLIHGLTHGVPRRINLLCDRALLGAYVENSREVTRKILRRAADEVFAGEQKAAVRRHWPTVAGGVLAGAALSAAAAWQVMPRGSAPAPRPAPAPVVALATRAPAPKPAPPVASAGYAREGDALRALASLWGQPLAAGDPCQAALKANLRCYQGKGGLYELRLLDRPAVVALHDGARLTWAVLGAIGERSVTLLAGGQRQSVDLADFVARFDGAFTTLWKVPRGFREEVAAGDHGADVDWIAERLAQLNKVGAPQVDQPFDARTAALLREFQKKQNLKADGVAGPRTFMRLNQLSGVDEPRLLAAAGTGK
jgi:general secretion pathway protein A